MAEAGWGENKYAGCSRMKRAASTPHASALPSVDVQPFGSHHGDNLYNAYVQDQRIKHRSVISCFAPDVCYAALMQGLRCSVPVSYCSKQLSRH